MAVVTLSTLRDYWKRVYDWISGTYTTTYPGVELKGSLAQNGQVLTNVTVPAGAWFYSGFVDVASFSKVVGIVVSDGAYPVILYAIFSDNGSTTRYAKQLFNGNLDGSGRIPATEPLPATDVVMKYVQFGIKNTDTVDHTFNAWIRYGN